MKSLSLLLLLCVSAYAQQPEKAIVKLPNLIAGCVDLGSGYYDCEERAVLPPEAVILTQGADRYTALVAADKAAVYRATVHRMKDGTSLRSNLATLLGITITARTRIADLNLTLAQKQAIRAKLIEYLQANTTDRVTVRVADVLVGDVVEDALHPHIWLGETAP